MNKEPQYLNMEIITFKNYAIKKELVVRLI